MHTKKKKKLGNKMASMVSHCTRNKIQIYSSGLQVWCDQSLLTSAPILLSCTAGPLYQLLPSPYFCRLSSFPSELRHHLLREALLENPVKTTSTFSQGQFTKSKHLMIFKVLVATRNYLNYGFTLLTVSPSLEMKFHESRPEADSPLSPRMGWVRHGA